jgi:hypothetical protein
MILMWLSWGWVWWHKPVIPITWEADIGGIAVTDQPRPKVSVTPISTNNPGMVTHL